MNKKIILLIIAIVIIVVGFCIFLSNYNNSSNTDVLAEVESIDESDNIAKEDDTQNDEIVVADKVNSDNKKIAVIYFSATGNTKKVAEYIKETAGGDLIEIIPKDEYTDNDLDYNNKNSRCTKEQNDTSARPEIANNINTDSYDVIYLGYPIWWGDAPRIILTFLDKANLSGKTVIPFCTSGSSGIETSVNNFKSNYKNINWLAGKRLSISQSEVTNWVNSLNY